MFLREDLIPYFILEKGDLSQSILKSARIDVTRGGIVVSATIAIKAPTTELSSGRAEDLRPFGSAGRAGSRKAGFNQGKNNFSKQLDF